MIRSLWIAKTGMEGQQTKLDVISNNLANVGTNGYKRGGVVFEDLMYQNLRQTGAAAADQGVLPTGLQVGLGSRVSATTRNFNQGSLQQTSSDFDLAINGRGFFQVQMPDGGIGYTRDGSFQLDSTGQLVNASGMTLAPGGLTIPANTQKVTVSREGVITATVVTNGASTQQAVGQIQLANFANPGGLEPRGQNLFTETASSGAPQAGAPGANGLGTIQQGAVEGSNVNVVEELVAMIATQRAYELNSKAIQTSDQMLQRLGQL